MDDVFIVSGHRSCEANTGHPAVGPVLPTTPTPGFATEYLCPRLYFLVSYAQWYSYEALAALFIDFPEASIRVTLAREMLDIRSVNTQVIDSQPRQP
jgi:hypothetical protein